MILIAKRNMVLDNVTYRDGQEIKGVDSERAERYVRDGLAAYVESPGTFEGKLQTKGKENEEIENLDPEKKPSKRKE